MMIFLRIAFNYIIQLIMRTGVLKIVSNMTTSVVIRSGK